MIAVSLAEPAVAAEPGAVDSYRETIDVAGDGSARVIVHTKLHAGSAGALLPLNFVEAKDFAVDAAVGGVTATRVRRGDLAMLDVRVDHPLSDDLSLNVMFAVAHFVDWKKRTPRGDNEFSYTFLNTTVTKIDSYELTLVLPSGYRMSKIRNTGKGGAEEPASPGSFATEGGRLVVRLRPTSLGAGKSSAIAFCVRAGEKPTGRALGIGLLLAALGLYAKRNALRRSDFARETA